ncbi:hypothetical protein B0I35DRAFT_516726 [Stachybotrys elegans]|uniref:Short-chain dehydrogenase/reductase 3 n=1 Tax=Stachybotrys elegans TaxID=80388 RepID=A0A8K0WK40_9HYPO|nr:hypothetical protein B0I35DRAFT_516726 [Stachybotrys elegans]
MPLIQGVLSPLLQSSILLAGVVAAGSMRIGTLTGMTGSSVASTRLPVIMAVLRLALAGEALRRINRALNAIASNSWRLKASPGWHWPDEIAVVTGGCGGIGLGVALKLAEHGVRVAVLDIKDAPESLQESSRIRYYKCDISDPSAVADVANLIREELGHPSILINNAGICGFRTIMDITESYIHRIFGVNAIAHFLTTKQFLPHMIQSDKGHIITVASLASYITLARAADYSATKAAALAFHEALRSELKHFYKAPNVMTTSVHTNWVDTPILDGLEDFFKKEGIRPLSSDYVAEKIVNHILSNTGGRLILPEKDAMAATLPGWPMWMQELTRDFYGRRATRVM